MRTMVSMYGLDLSFMYEEPAKAKKSKKGKGRGKRGKSC